MAVVDTVRVVAACRQSAFCGCISPKCVLRLLQEQRSHLGKFLRNKMGLPSFVGQLLGLITPILELQRKSDAANEVRGLFLGESTLDMGA